MTEKLQPSWWPVDAPDVKLEWVEEPLSLEKLYDLVRIAHETTDPQVKEAAIATLMRALHPAVRV